MPIEIERKYIVANDGWRVSALGPTLPIRQGYLSPGDAGTPSVRVRRIGAAAVITVKGPGLTSRQEFEYPIPPEDAEAMFASGLCAPPWIEKRRTRVLHAGLVWEVDEFAGHLAGLVLAEVELPSAETPVPLPPWVGREVSDDPRYLNSALARAAAPPAG